MIDYKLVLPDDFDDYSLEIVSKGWFNDAIAIIAGNRYKITFYDQVRLSQDIQEELGRATVFFEPNLLIIKSVDRKHMEKAIKSIAIDGMHAGMVKEDVL